MASRSAVVVAVDQGTSSTKALALDESGEVIQWASVPLGIAHPRPGWVEQDPAELAAGVLQAIAEVTHGIGDRVAAIGLSTQRESAVAWDPATGRALGPMLGWQDRRTADAAAALAEAAPRIRAITGLPLDPMFSALKFAWLLDEIDPDRERAAAGGIALGTVDAFLAHRLTGELRIEAGNASRTQLMDLAARDWSDELLDLFRVPRAALPRITASDEATGPVLGLPALPPHVRVHAVLGDSHAALYGHGVREPGAVKVTLGTGSSVMGLVPAGTTIGDGLAATLAWETGAPAFAFEGNVLATGATLVWLAEVLGTTPGELVDLAWTAEGPSTVDLVPAFAGLGAPWWDANAQAVVSGFDLGTSRAALARAAVESLPLQIEDVLAAAERTTGTRIGTVLVDGGPAGNDRLVQLLADLTGRRVERPDAAGLSAIGAARLAGIAAGVWRDGEAEPVTRQVFEPALPAAEAAERRERWHRALARSRYSPPSASPSDLEGAIP